MEGIYLDRFDNKADVEGCFGITLAEDQHILFAQYVDESYSGKAWVIYYDSTQKKLYEVHGSHCSCYGLEGQFDMEETSKEDLLERISRGGQSDYDTGSVKEAIQSWSNLIMSKKPTDKLYLIDNFDFDNLPTPDDIKNSISIQQVLQSNEIIENEATVIKNFKNSIVTAIKEGASHQLSEVCCEQKLQLTKLVQPLTKTHSREIEQKITKIFQPTLDKLREKQWGFTFIVDKDNISIKIKLPFEPTLTKKIGNFRKM